MNHSFQQSHRSVWLVCALTALLFLGAHAHAQPSGGPYGPIQQTYKLPTNANHVYYVAPDGSEDATGTSLQQPTTLEKAIAKAVTGDAIILRGGTYRTGDLRLNQGITMQPYADEQPVLKGTRVATEWIALRNNVWRTPWKTLFPAALPAGTARRPRTVPRIPVCPELSPPSSRLPSSQVLNNPANPMNARDRLPAMISTRPMFRATAGMLDNSDVSRIEAISTRASVSPSPAPIANDSPSRKSYPRLV